MYDPNFQKIFVGLKEAEGGFVDNPLDSGGPTKYGITIPFLAVYRGVDKSHITVDDIKNLTIEEAMGAYYYNLWERHSVSELPPSIQPVVFNLMVISGPQIATKILQKKSGAKIDGVLGPKTIEAVKLKISATPEKRHFKNELVKDIMRFFIRIVRRQPEKRVFLEGWYNRFCEFHDFGY